MVSGEVLWWVAGASVVCFFGTLVAIPFFLVRLPADFFDVRVPRRWMGKRHPVWRVAGHVVKNVVGVVFVVGGFLMLFLPGQGVLTMLVGVSLVDFPGKRRLEAAVVGRPRVLAAVNRIRARFGKPGFVLAPRGEER
jgi:hypothetical protein